MLCQMRDVPICWVHNRGASTTLTPLRKKPDPLSLTMALVEAYAKDDQTLIDRARGGLASVTTMDVLSSLLQFGTLLNRACTSTESLDLIRGELDVSGSTPEMTNAVRHLGRALFIDRTRESLVGAINEHVPPLLESPSDEFRRAALTLAFIAGNISRSLKVSFNWR